MALKLKEAGQNHQVVSGELKDHIEQVQQQVLTSDLQLLRTLREQILAHFEVDETDSMVQHLEHLIGDREGVLAQLEQGMGSPPSAVNPRNVRTNPFMVASYRDNHQTEVNQELQTSQSMLAGIRLDETYRLLDQLRLSLENPVVGRIPIVPFEREIETQPAHFQVTELKTSGVPQPTDGVPSDRWMLGLGLVAGLIGAAFSLQWQPFQLGRQISNSRQLADMLGLELMGSLSGGREKPGVLERFLVRLGAGAFRVAEVALLLFLCGVIVAMIWDQQLPGIILDRPVTGFCRAIWVLFGR